MALGLKDLKNGRRRTTSQNNSYKRKNLRPWESYNEFESTKTQTIRAHEAVLKAQERLKENSTFEPTIEKVRDDIYSEEVYLQPEERIPDASDFNLLAPTFPAPLALDIDEIDLEQIDFPLKKSEIPELALNKEKSLFTNEKGGLFSFLRFIFN